MKIPENQDAEHLVFGLFFALHNRLQKIGDLFYEEITVKQWFALAIITSFPVSSPPALSETAAMMGSSHQNMKQLLLKLEKKGYIQLKRDHQDRRQLRIHLTGQIADLQKKYGEKEILFMNALFKNIPPEQLEITLQTLIAINSNLEEMENAYEK